MLVTKKVIAREILFIAFVLPIAIITYIIVVKKQNNIKTDIKQTQISYDSVMNIFGPHNREYYNRLVKRELFYDKIYTYDPDTKEYLSYTYDIKLWKTLEGLYKTNRLSTFTTDKWSLSFLNQLTERGINNFDELNSKVAEVYISPEYEARNNELKKQRDYLDFRRRSLPNQLKSKAKQMDDILMVVYYYLIIFFGLRYFIFCVIWSIQTLRLKEKNV